MPDRWFVLIGWRFSTIFFCFSKQFPNPISLQSSNSYKPSASSSFLFSSSANIDLSFTRLFQSPFLICHPLSLFWLLLLFAPLFFHLPSISYFYLLSIHALLLNFHWTEGPWSWHNLMLHEVIIWILTIKMSPHPYSPMHLNKRLNLSDQQGFTNENIFIPYV